MRRRIAHAMTAVLLVVSLGAAQGPTSSGSKELQGTTSKSVRTTDRTVGRRNSTHHRLYQVGTASWYGSYFEGRATASGEPYNMYDLTAAHPTLPLGTWVRVTNLHNGRRIYVRINDRGPIVPGRIIDLSYGAAEALHITGKGLQRVRLDLAAPEEQPQQIAMLQPLAY
ncbi:MAG TPA: septal ring lytic transglycosylase RlpA family protein [Terriglobales bacterium]|nr:septal ring lytic transglycosylase RlpA family protein [Terriglobales bacterium]